MHEDQSQPDPGAKSDLGGLLPQANDFHEEYCDLCNATSAEECEGPCGLSIFDVNEDIEEEG